MGDWLGSTTFAGHHNSMIDGVERGGVGWGLWMGWGVWVGRGGGCPQGVVGRWGGGQGWWVWRGG
ncbi:putative RiPP precursor [Micromonospora sp. HM134]|nr:putative RiPP precursor [Micromonospora sp. HM134]